MGLESLGFTAGKVCSVDDEIAVIEKAIEEGRMEHMITVGLMKEGPLFKVMTMPCGCSLPKTREILQLAVNSINDIIGKPEGEDTSGNKVAQ